jgi:hypothetical protein
MMFGFTVVLLKTMDEGAVFFTHNLLETKELGEGVVIGTLVELPV